MLFRSKKRGFIEKVRHKLEETKVTTSNSTLDRKKPFPTEPEREEKVITSSFLKENEKFLIVQEETNEIPKMEEISKEKLKRNMYVVKKGDNLWEIAKRFNTSVKNLRVANNLRSNRLDIGDVLIIPGSEKEVAKKAGSGMAVH